MVLIKSKKASDCSESEVTPEKIYHKRRQFMTAGALIGAGLALNSFPAKASIAIKNYQKSAFSTDEELTPFNDAARYNNFYEFGTDKGDPVVNAKDFNTDDWMIKVSGECEVEGTFALEDLVKDNEIEERIYRLRCVEAWSMVIPWLGVPLGTILKRFKPTSKANYVAFRTLLDSERMPGQSRPVLDWPYAEGLRMDEAMNSLSLLSVGMYGKTLPNQNGAPVRLVVPWKYGFKSIKSIVEIKFTEKEPYTTWNLANPREYGFYSNVNPSVRHPRWSQAKERRIGDFFKRKTLMFNGYTDEVEAMYRGMDLKKYF